MNLFTFIKNNISILDVIKEYTTLKQAGYYWKGHCPFHSEKTASFTVSPHKAIFYCFGCHMGGDVIAFIAKVEVCSPIEAAKMLADRYQLALPEEMSSQTNAASIEKKKGYLNICTLATRWYAEQLAKNPSVLAYLNNRSINKKSIDYFSIGYFPGGLNAVKSFIQYMQKQNILVDDLIEAAILTPGKSVLYSPYEERIIFPIKDGLGRICGFGGRIFKPHDERAKYYNSRENDYFSKGSLLFGLDLAKKAIQESGKVFLVEGYTDCIAMVQYGFPQTVATLGTACTTEHLNILSRYAQELYVIFDGDKAGHEAMLRLTELCWQVDMELKVIALPATEDPASYLTKGQDMKALIDQAQDIFDFFITSAGINFAQKNLNQKMQLSRRIIDTIARVTDPLKQDILLQKAAQTLDIPFESLKKNSTTAAKKAPASPAAAPFAPPLPILFADGDSQPKLEKKLFFAIMNNIQLLNSQNTQYLIEYLPAPLNSIIQHIATAKEQLPELDFIQFFDLLLPAQQQYVSKLLLENNQDSSPEEFEQLLLTLQKKNWKHIVQNMKLKLAEQEEQANKEIIETIVRDFLELKRKVLHKNLI